jgi:integrase
LDAQLCLKAVLHDLYSGHNVPSLRELYEGATCYLSLRVPSFLVSFATGKLVSATVATKVWIRLLHDKAVRPEQDSLPEAMDALPGQQQFVADGVVADMKKQEPLRMKLVSLLGEARRGRVTCKPTRRKLEEYWEENNSQMAPVLQMMTQWALEMLGRAEMGLSGRKGRNPLQPGSIATYLSSFDKELLACAGKDDISHYDSDELRDLYDDVVKAVKRQSQQHTASYRLTQFHRFLMRAYGAPVIDMGGMVTSKGPPVLGVDANLLSPQMFRSLLYSLGWNLPEPCRLQTMRCLVTLLGYRCGLRRREALSVRLGDIMGTVAPELVIRTSYLNRLKTTDSARRLPLHLLLEPDELKGLLRWREMRIAEEASGRALDAPLFGDPGCRETVRDSLIFDEIHALMRYIADDPKLRFHHLRHSFANRLLLVLVAQESPDVTLPGQFKQFCEFHLPHSELIRGLFGSMSQGRQFLFGISTLLGHADPSMTLQSYVHLLDLLLCQAVSNPKIEPLLSVEAVMQITGLKRAMAFRTRAEKATSTWNMGSFTGRMARHCVNNFADPHMPHLHVVTPPDPHEGDRLSNLPDWKLVKHALRLHQVQGWSVGKIADRLQIPLESVQAWCLGALAIKAMTTKEGKSRHLTAWQRKQDTGDNILFPAPPDRATDLALLDKIIKTVSVLPVEQMEFVRSGCLEFIERYSCNQGYARFTDFAGALSFKKFLNLIGVPSEMVFVSMFAKHSPPLKNELDLQQQVFKLLDMDASRMLTSGKRHVKYRRNHECSVGFMVASTQRPIHRKNKPVAAETVYGFRYALYLLAIGLECMGKPPAAN